MFTIKRASVVKEKGYDLFSSVTERTQIEKTLITVQREYVRVGVICLILLCTIFPLFSHAEEQTDVVNSIVETESSFTNLYPVEQIPASDDEVIGDFVVGPGKIEVAIKPGESKTVEMTVTNRTGERKRFKISTEDIAGSNDTETAVVLLGSDRGPYSMKDYVSVPHRSFDLGHNQRVRIPVTVTLPPNAEPGGLYGSVLVQTIAIEGKPGTAGTVAPQAPIIARIGTLFFITIPGGVEKDGALKDFSTVPTQTFFQSSPINLGVLFENKGVIHLTPYGELRIHNVFGEEVGYLKLDPWFVLPKSLRLREISWDRSLLFGRYTATVSVNRSYDDIVDEMSYSFWVLPWKPLVGTFVILFAIIFVIRAFFRKFEFKRKS